MNVLPNSAPGLDEESDDSDWLKRARAAYTSSTTYIDSNYRSKWENGIRAFNSEHPSDSKYNSPNYSKRSNLYRPKTRAVIRKNEAAVASAFFSNNDITSVEAGNMSDPLQQASAEVMKQLLQYRLSKSIPWFQVVLGGFQDAQKTGVVAARLYWDYREEKSAATPPKPQGKIKFIQPQPLQPSQPPQDPNAPPPPPPTPPSEVEPLIPASKPNVISDKPVIKIIPIENIRIDPASDWIDPVNTSPYIIEEMPMWISDIKERMKTPNPKTGEPDWIKLDDDVIRKAVRTDIDSTNAIRNGNREDPRAMTSRSISEYEIVWVQRHIHRKDGEDWEFYTLSDVAMLSKPQLLSESVLHGKRDYIMGNCILETHRPIPSSVPDLAANLQSEANEIANQRMDNVKLVLNKRFIVKRNKNVDLASLVKNVPGGITMVDDVADIQEMNWPDVTQSSYQEQQLLNQDFDELLGNFNASTLTPEIMGNAPARAMQLLSQPANVLTEYLIRTYVETFVEPVLRMLVKLEQYYETDTVILGLVAQKAQLFQKYGINEVTDELLNQELTLTVNVGMGATDPQYKSQKFLGGVMAYANIVKMQVPGLNTNEIGKELFGLLGYQDGKRFLSTDDPEKLQLQQQIQQLSQQVQGMSAQLKSKQGEQAVKLQVAQGNNQTDLVKTNIQQVNANKRALAEHVHSISQLGLSNEVRNALTQ